MNLDTILVVLLAWTGAGLLAAIAFGKMVRESAPEEDGAVAPAAGSVSYLRKNERKRQTATATGSKTRQTVTKRAAG